MDAYCVKCKAKREVKDPVAVTMKNGKPATQGGAGPAAPRSSRSALASSLTVTYG